MKTVGLWDITSGSPSKVDRRFVGTGRLRKKQVADLATSFVLVSCLAYSLTLKMEAVCSSERSVEFLG
jgi:hypothetical protein